MIKRLVKNFSWLMGAEVLSQVFAFLLTIVVARHLGAAGLGKFAFAFVLAETVFTFSDLGLNTYIIRELSRNKSKAKQYLGNLNLLRLGVGFISLLVVIIAAYVTGVPQDKFIVAIVSAVSLYLALIMASVNSIFASYEKMEYLAIEKLIKSGSNLLLGYLVLSAGYGLFAYSGTVFLSYFLTFIFSLVILKTKFMQFTFKYNKEVMKKMLQGSFPFWIYYLVLYLHTHVGILILSYIKGDIATGLFSVPDQLVRSLYFIPINFMLTIFPVMSRFFVKSEKNLGKIFTKSFEYLLLAIMPIAVGTTLLGPRIIEFFYKQQFAGSGVVLQILIWAAVFVFMNYLLGNYLASADKQKELVKISAIATVVNILANILLIPILGQNGTALALVVSCFIEFYFMFRLIPSSYTVHAITTAVKPIIAAIIMGGAILLVKDLHIVAIIAIGAVVYAVASLLTGAVGKDEFEIVKALRRKTAK